MRVHVRCSVHYTVIWLLQTELLEQELQQVKDERASLEEQNAALQKDMEARARGLPAAQGSGGGVGLDSFQIEQLRAENEKLRQAIRLYCFFLARFQRSIVVVSQILKSTVYSSVTHKALILIYGYSNVRIYIISTSVYFINTFYCTIGNSVFFSECIRRLQQLDSENKHNIEAERKRCDQFQTECDRLVNEKSAYKDELEDLKSKLLELQANVRVQFLLLN